MESHPRGGRRARFGRAAGQVRAHAGLAALALILAAGPDDAQAAPERLEVASLDLSTFDPGTLDFHALSGTDAMELAQRYHWRGNPAHALRVIVGKIEDLERDSAADLATLAQLHWYAAEAQRALRRFEEALTSLAESERFLEELRAGLDETKAAHRPRLDWADVLRCTQIGVRGWIQQDWGALDAALVSFERERAEIERLDADIAGVDTIRADSDRHLSVFAMLTGAPERIEALLRERTAGGGDTGDVLPFLRLRLAGAWWERERREGTPPERARATLEKVLIEEDLLPIDRVFGELWLAEIELDEGNIEEARELWSSAGARLEELGAHNSRARRSWVGVGARIAHAGGAEERRASRAALVGEIDAFLAEWRALDSREGGYGYLHLDDSLRLFGELTELSIALDGDEAGARAAFEVLNRAHAETALARRLGGGVPALDELRRALCPRPGDGVLVYLAAPTRSWLFVLDPGSLRALPVASLFAVERSRRTLVQELQVQGGAWTVAGRAAARELATLLLPATLRPWLDERTSLGVCGLDLFLGDVPFEALDLGDGQRVGAEWAVTRLPPLAASVELARRAARSAPAAPGLRVLAAPALAPELAGELGLQELTLVPDDLDEILRVFPAGSCDLFLGKDAHAGALAGAPRTVLQFLVHGRFDETKAPGAELVLAPAGAGDDGLLGAADVERLFGGGDAPRMAVLTACRTGREVQRRGDADANSLAGAFLGCGAQTVVASSYDLDLALAGRVSTEFYRALASGAEPGEALRRARTELARDPTFAESAQPFLLRAIGAPAVHMAPWSAAERRNRGAWIAVGAAGAIAVVGLARRMRRAAPR